MTLPQESAAAKTALELMAAPRFLRFTVTERHPRSQEAAGLFTRAWQLSDAGELLPWEEARWRQIARWFAHHLPEPPSATRSRRPGAPNRAIFWFRASAIEHIRRMREVADLLERHGTPTAVLQSERPGYIVYEDEFQVAAEPFRSEIERSAVP